MATVNHSPDSYRGWFEPKRGSNKSWQKCRDFLFYAMYTVYVLFSEKLNRFYIGATSDFGTRWHYHQHAENHKFTHKASDWTLFLSIECATKTQAFAVEKHIKAMKSKTYIQNLKKYPEMTQKLLQKYGDC